MDVKSLKGLPGNPVAAAPPMPGGATAAAPGAPTVNLPASAPVQQPTNQQAQQAVETLRRLAQPVAQNLQFSVDKETGATVIRVIDENTNEVIRQIPSEDILALTASLDKLSGLLLKDKA
jgi:flagellar protein FlaG